jgi:hypothetical protein
MTTQSVAMKTEPTAAKPKRGRKPASESRATEIRIALAKWRQIPEEQRPSLRALAAELKTSHQLLCSYLRTLNEWLAEQKSEEYSRRSREITDRADAKGRVLTEAEAELVVRYSRARLRCILDAHLSSFVERNTAEMRKAAKMGKLTVARRIARLLARTGNAEAKQFLQTGQIDQTGQNRSKRSF